MAQELAVRFEPTMPLSRFRHLCARARGLTGARPELSQLAAAWEQALDDVLAVEVATARAEDEALSHAAAEELESAAWDDALRALASSALALAQEASRAPYEPLFGALPVSAYTALGPAKHRIVGDRVLPLARRLLTDEPAHLPLRPAIDAFAAANERLSAAVALRAREADQRYAFELAKAQLIRRLAELHDETRLALSRVLPGREGLLDPTG